MRIVISLLLIASFIGCAEGAQLRRPKDFGLLIASGRGELIDTSRGRVTKDLVMGPDTTITLRLSSAELDTLHAIVTRSGILDLPEPHPVQDRGSPITVPNMTMHVIVRAGGRVREFRWSTEHRPATSALGQWDKLHRLIATSRRMVARHPAYRKLPNARGSYL